MAKLAIVLNGQIAVNNNHEVLLSEKSLSGLIQYQNNWPGELYVVAEIAQTPEAHNLGNQWISQHSLPFELVLTNNLATSLTSINPQVSLLWLDYQHRNLLATPGKKILIAEFTPEEKIKTSLKLNQHASHAPKILAGGLKRRAIIREMAKNATGLQCNGWAAWQGLQQLNANTIRYYDTRLTLELIQNFARNSSSLTSTETLKLGFSGRLTESKGPGYAVQLHNQLNKLGIQTSLTIFGAGELEKSLTEQSLPPLNNAGEINFATEWVPRVVKEIDLMVLPHVQADPSGTYLETAGLGVPVLGFANPAWTGLVNHNQVGWAVKTYQGNQLLAITQRLLTQPKEVARVTQNATEFMKIHHFEAEFKLRIDQLIQAVS